MDEQAALHTSEVPVFFDWGQTAATAVWRRGGLPANIAKLPGLLRKPR